MIPPLRPRTATRVPNSGQSDGPGFLNGDNDGQWADGPLVLESTMVWRNRCTKASSPSDKDALECPRRLFGQQLADSRMPLLVKESSHQREAALEFAPKRQLRPTKPPATGCGLLPLQRLEGGDDRRFSRRSSPSRRGTPAPDSPQPFGVGPQVSGEPQIVKPAGLRSLETKETRSASHRARTCGQKTAFPEMTSLNSGEYDARSSSSPATANGTR